VSSQLDLFDWQPRTNVNCKVRPFPMSRRIGKARDVAQKISEKSSSAAEAYWKQTVRAMAAQMRAAGISEPEVISQLEAFSTLVGRQMRQVHKTG
jgi:Family of unknown function (DUF6074)